MLANVLVTQAAGTLDAGEERLPATGPSFRDATRVAGAPSAIWTDIYLSNRDALVAELDGVDRAAAAGCATALVAGDGEAITRWNDAAAEDRRRLLEDQLAGGRAVSSCGPRCPTGPGVIAELALGSGGPGSTSPTWRCIRPRT